MKVQELIKLINENELYSLSDAEDLIYDAAEIVEHAIELDQHRWYSVATDVYKCDDGYVGVCGVFQSFSESQTHEDIDFLCEAEEYEEVLTVTYKPKT